MGLSSFLFRRRLAVCGVALSAALGCGGEFSARNGSDGGTGTGGKHVGGDGGATGSGGDADSGTSAGGTRTGSGGDANGGAGAGRPGTGGRGSGGRATGTGGNGTSGTSAGGAAAGGAGGVSGGAGTGGSTTTQLASSYDQKCTYDSQCVVVGQGDVCACTARCPNAAIASTAIGQWNLDRSQIQCADPPICPAVACQAEVATCAIGKCIARKPLIIDATHYDQTCASNDACVQIFTGEVCSSCQCAVGAVSAKGYQDYLRDKASVSCSPGPSPCDCAPPVGQVHCAIPVGQDKGTCTIP